MQMALASGYRRYIQSELVSGPRVYAEYFGADILAKFRAVKQFTDPHTLFNRGWLFPVAGH